MNDVMEHAVLISDLETLMADLDAVNNKGINALAQLYGTLACNLGYTRQDALTIIGSFYDVAVEAKEAVHTLHAEHFYQ